MSAGAGQAIVGIDIGGTFTDLVCVLPDGTLKLAKLRSTPSNPARAVLDAVVAHAPDRAERALMSLINAANADIDRVLDDRAQPVRGRPAHRQPAHA